MNPVF